MKKRSLRSTDPHLAREQGRYEHPIPSREFILQVLAEQGVPVQPDDLARLLDITRAEAEPFERRLEAMERAGQVMRNRKGALCVVEKLDLVRGRVEGHPDGFGFLIPEAGGPDIFLGPKQMHKVLHGDRAMVRITGADRRGRPEGKIVEVLERGARKVVGRLHVEHGIPFVVAEDRRLSQDILVPKDQTANARPGQVVTVDIIEPPNEHAQPIGRVVEVLGNYADPGMEIEIALRKHDLPHAFSREAERQADRFPPRVQARDLAGREDLRELPLVTIDGETARDFDDAVYCEEIPPIPPLKKGGARGDLPGKGRQGGFRLWVAIADVSYYVRPGDALDREALERGNSVYFPRRVIPMLPEALSNGLCSLNPEVERLCMVCEMAVGARGDIGEYRFYPAVMRSAARLTYNEVWAILENPRGTGARGRRALVPHLEELHRLFQVLAKARAKRGAIDFETIETEMVFDAHGKIERILPVKRNDAHRLIEECMLAANVCASDFLREHGQPTLYRIHEGPTPEKLAALREFLAEFGLHLSGGDEPHAKDYAALLEKVRDRPDAQLIQTVMLRSLSQAVYSPENVGHFGLAYESYTHFTSPIRRYPDLLVHRAIKAVLAGGRYSPGDWKQLGAHCSMTERRADDATRDVQTWLKCYFMQDRVGEAFAGTVSGVAPFGLFVALDEVYVEGLVHVSELGADYYQHDAARHMLVGERTRRSFRLGDRLRVRVVRVDIEAAKVDFVLDEGEGGRPSGRGRAGPRRPRRTGD
jgi:ribonuclease R